MLMRPAAAISGNSGLGHARFGREVEESGAYRPEAGKNSLLSGFKAILCNDGHLQW